MVGDLNPEKDVSTECFRSQSPAKRALERLHLHIHCTGQFWNVHLKDVDMLPATIDRYLVPPKKV